MSFEIVVDASVARAAGRGKGEPPAPACVAALDAITEGGLSVVLSSELKQEWTVHAREYATKWLANLVSRKRFRFIKEVSWSDWEALADAATDLPGKQPDAVAKDSHLVALAMCTDRRVLSGDVRQRAFLQALLPRVPGLSALYWCAPVEPETAPWLAAGAPDRPELTLGG